jgi:hypothetical protein
VDGGQLIALSGAVLGVGDDVVVVVMRSWSWLSRTSFSRWRFGRLAGIDGQLTGGANLRRGQSIQVCAQLVVRLLGRSKPSGGGLRHIPAPH